MPPSSPQMRFTTIKTTLVFGIPAILTGCVWLVGLTSARPAAAPAETSLSLRILDERGNPVMARLRLRDSAGQARPPELLDGVRAVPIHPKFPELGIVLPREGRLKLPKENPPFRSNEVRSMSRSQSSLMPRRARISTAP